MEDDKCVKRRVIQFDLGSYSNPVWIAKNKGIGSDVWERDGGRTRPSISISLLSKSGCHCEYGCEFTGPCHRRYLCYLQDGIADTFLDAACYGAQRSDKRRDARLVYVVSYFDRMGSGASGVPRRALARRRWSTWNVHRTGRAYE